MKPAQVQKRAGVRTQAVRTAMLVAATVVLSGCPSDATDFVGFIGGVYTAINTTLDPVGVSVLPGQTASAKAVITRDPGWEGDASFTVTGAPSGVTVAVVNVVTSGQVTSADIRFTVASDVPYKAYDLVLHGNMDTHSLKTAKENLVPFVLTVHAPYPTITLSDQKVSFKAGQSQNLTVTVLNASGTGKVQWVTSDPSVVSMNPTTVDASATGATTTLKGLKKGGPVNVIANYTSADGSIVGAQVEVTVTDSLQGPAPTISVSPTTMDQLQIGQQIPVTAIVTNASGTAQVQWTSADPSIVSVSPANVAASATGSQTAFSGVKTGGPVNVVASYTANGVTVTATVVVKVIAPTNSPLVVVSPHAMSLSQGRTTTLSAAVTNGLNVTDVTWSTGDASIATVAANGSRSVTVTGVKAGSSTYVIGSYAYSGGTSRDSALVTVTAASTAQVDHITLEPDSSNVINGQQVQYRVRYWNASNVEMNGEVGNTTAFTVDVSSVAQIGGSTGLATTRGIGATFVNASYRMPYYDSLSPVKASLTAKAKLVVH